MVTTTPTAGYSHTQHAPLCFILYGSALLCLVIALQHVSYPAIYIAGAVCLLIAVLATAFHYLRVTDRGDRLAISFGPLPLFGTTVQYDQIDRVEVGRTLFLDGWGIHYSVRGGWVWNIWGRDCVVVHRRDGSVLRIGSDDTQTLAQFLQAQIRP
ncbi:MAG: hypothetical protein U0840_11505 [Gemmataceae bacterium]